MQFGSFESHQDLPVVTTKTPGTNILMLFQLLCVLPPRQQSHLAAALKIDKLPGFSVLLDASNFNNIQILIFILFHSDPHGVQPFCHIQIKTRKAQLK